MADPRRRAPPYPSFLEYHYWPETHPVLTVSVCYLPPWLARSSALGKDLARYLSDYPSLGGYGYIKANDGPDTDPAMTRYNDGWGEVIRNLPAPDGRQATETQRRMHFESIATRHGRR